MLPSVRVYISFTEVTERNNDGFNYYTSTTKLVKKYFFYELSYLVNDSDLKQQLKKKNRNNFEF